MTVARLQTGHSRWKVREQNQSLLVAPAAGQVKSILAANRELIWRCQDYQNYDFQGNFSTMCL